jgi:spore maturation protein CgeB
MVEKAKYYLEHDEEREKIARAGYDEFINNHTYKHRVEKILSIVTPKK